MRAMSCCGLMPSLSALSMIGAPCASSAPTKCSWCPCILWKRTQMSAWMYSMMCPIWNGPLAYGSAVVTKILRGIRASLSAGILHILELRLVDGLLVGLLARDLALIQQLLDRGVHGAHAELSPRLHGVLELVELALAYEVGGGGGVHQDLERRHAALLVGALQQLLRNDAPERRRQHGAHVRLLVGREDVHHAVDGRRRAVGVQRPHDENAHLRRGDRDAHGLAVARLADHDQVRVYAEAPAIGERIGEVGAVLDLETFQRRLRQDLVKRLLDELRSELVGLERREIAEQADTRRITGDEVQIRAALLKDFEQQGVDLRHAVRCAQAAEFEVGAGAGAAASTLDSMLVSVTYFWKARFSRAYV